MKLNLDKIENLLVSLFSILVVITSGTVWASSNGIFKKILTFISIVLILKNIKNIFTKKIFYLLIFIILQLIYSSVYPENIKIFIYWDIILLVALVLSEKRENKVLNIIYKFIIFYSLFNIIMYSLIQFGIITSNKYIFLSEAEMIANKKYYSYYNLYYNWQKSQSVLGYEFMRNAGIFLEAGRYGVFLNFALIYELYVKEKASKFWLMIIIINTITTFSTTTIIILIIAITVRIFKNNNKGYLMAIKVLVGILFAVIMFNLAIKVINDKIYGTTDSFSSRKYDVEIAFKYFKEKPILGYGIENNNVISQSAFYAGNSNGITKLLYQGGVYFFSIYVIMYILFIRNIYKRKGIVSSIIISVFILLQVMSQVMIYDVILLYFLYYFSMGSSNEKFKKNNIQDY